MNIIPVLKLGPVLLVSIQHDLQDRTAELLQEAILEKLYKTHATAVLIDVTALEIVDSFVGRVLSETAQMAQMMNARVVLAGVQPAVAITVIELGMDLSGVDTAINVERGLEQLGFRMTAISRSSERQDRVT